MSLIPVILSGGAGSRLWPVSREAHPKSFIREADGQSLLQKTFLRGARLPGISEVLTVSNREFFFKTEDEYREVNRNRLATSFVLEPFGRNTAAAVATATVHVAKRHPDATLLVLAANESTYIPAGHRHRLENPRVVNLVMIEVQSGEYLGEDDIVRFECIYGRAGPNPNPEIPA